MNRYFVACFLVVILMDNGVLAVEKLSRQKRCIVIQKQSGGKADSGEGADDEDYDFKRPQPKAPSPDRLRDDRHAGSSKNDVEALSPELLKYKKKPNQAMFRRMRLKNRLQRSNSNM